MKQFIYPYILLENSYEAAKYYEKVLGGEITYVMLGKDTPECPDEHLEDVYHLQLKVNNSEFYFADYKSEVSNAIQMHLDYESKDDLDAVYNRFIEESEVIQELGETFWGAYFGVIKDKYGITWQFHHMLKK